VRIGLGDAVGLRTTYDPDADAAYLYLKYPIADGEVDETVPAEVSDATPVGSGINLDFDKDRRLLGIEILGAKRLLGDEVLREFSD
jgi:uncharacterized protein YuzE